MKRQEDVIFMFFLFSLVLFTVLVHVHPKLSLLFFGLVVVLMLVYSHMTATALEPYDPMDFFPWNEARLVRKRDPNSTVIDCGWFLDQPQNDNVFKLDDPIVREYSNQA